MCTSSAYIKPPTRGLKWLVVVVVVGRCQTGRLDFAIGGADYSSGSLNAAHTAMDDG